ncbi:TPA: hypothetical protein ACIX8V_004971, partial [Escherichia coli]
GFVVLGVPNDGAMLQAQMVLDQVISLVTTHWQQDVSEVYVCTSFVQAHRQYLIPRYAQISVGGGMEDRQSTKNKYHSVWIVQ